MSERLNDATWWRDGVFYQIYVRSFSDSNGDGVGDLQGIIDHLDDLAWLGVDGLWLSPINPSPNLDWGYDVTDYKGVDPELGDLETLDRLVTEADARGIRILLDLVPNHTSDRHPWFVDARTARDSAFRDRYVWAEPRPDGSPPNNWHSMFGGSAWELDPRTDEYFLHNFLVEQPDLNWWHDDVRREFDDILRFWFERGIAGFRIDVAHGLVKDHELRDNPAVELGDQTDVIARYQRFVYNMSRPEVHDVLRSWRVIANGFDPPRVLVGETFVFALAQLSDFYGAADELHLCFNFAFVHAPLRAGSLREIVETTEAALAPHAQPVWTGSNHDAGRFSSRWCGDHPDRVRCALMILLTLRGTPFLYYGDEIGMTDEPVPDDQIRDVIAKRLSGIERDRSRTPMRWTADPGAGFSTDGVRPWLPVGRIGSVNVAEQREDRHSLLHLCRDLIALRRGTPDLRSGVYESLPTPADVWAWRRGDDIAAAVNLSDEHALIEVGPGRVLIATERQRDGDHVGPTLDLGPWQGVVLRRGD